MPPASGPGPCTAASATEPASRWRSSTTTRRASRTGSCSALRLSARERRPERLHAFGAGYLELLDRHAELIAAASPPGRDGQGPHGTYAMHLRILLAELDAGLDPDFTAQALLASLSPGHFVHLRRGLGWSNERVLEGWCRLVDALG